jgi:hypothetical protein
MPQTNSRNKRHNVLIVPLTPEQADQSRQRLIQRAAEEGWPPARLRAKRAWVTMGTVGWSAPAALRTSHEGAR